MFLRHANAWSVKTQTLCKFKFNINASGNSLAKLLLRTSITSTSTNLGVATSWADLPCSTRSLASCHTLNVKHGFKWLIFMAVFMFTGGSGCFSIIFPSNTFGEWRVSCSSVRSWEQWEHWPVCQIPKLLPWLVRQKLGFCSQTSSLYSQMIPTSNHETLTLFATVGV